MILRFLLFFGILLALPFTTISAIDIDTSGCRADMDQWLQDMLGACAADHAISPEAIGDGPEGFKAYVVIIANGILWFAALFAVGALVYSGILYTTAYGEDEKIKNAKTTAQYALIGLALALLAFPIVKIIVDFIYELG